jgi:hypothetical protein
MPAKYDKETVERVLRMFSERRIEVPEESQAASANQGVDVDSGAGGDDQGVGASG